VIKQKTSVPSKAAEQTRRQNCVYRTRKSKQKKKLGKQQKTTKKMKRDKRRHRGRETTRKMKRQDLAEKHQASEDEARLAQLQEGEQVHALVLSLLQQCVDPAIVTPHAAQRLHVAQHPTNHPWDACSNACV